MHHWVRAAALLAAVSALVGGNAAAASAAGYCDVTCQLELQKQNALDRSDFYEPLDPLPAAPIGVLIRREFTTEYVVSGSAVPATRILYHTRTSRDVDTAASGVVLVPAGRPPRGGWPVVVDAHGSSGIGRDCAPSLMRDLYHGNQMLRFVQAGYAVVAPDYAGLGTDGRHELGNKVAAANDVVGALRAARTGVPGLAAKWVLWGHSQGGAAALSVAERQVRAPQPGYLGAVITSPAADLKALAVHVLDTPGLGGFAPLLTVGAQTADPRIRVDQLLSREALARLPITATGCLGVVATAYADLSGDALATPAYSNDTAFNRYLADNSFGTRLLGGPVLLLQGSADTVVPQAGTDALAAALCRNHTHLDYRRYAGLEHDTYPWVTGIDDGAMLDILAWTAARFAGQPARSTCGR